MTALRLPQQTITASCSEQIAHLAQALDQGGVRTHPALEGVHLGSPASWNAQSSGGSASILILCGHNRKDDGHARLAHCYHVQTALAPLPPPTREAGDGTATCLSVQLDLQVAAELMLTLGDVHPCPPDARSMRTWLPLDADMGDTVLRLLQALHCPIDALVLGAGIVRELLYRVLTGPQGVAVHAVLSQQGSMRRIGKALRRIRESYAEAVDVAALANEAGMSIAAFHAHFKAVTQTTPIQFLKTTRLRQARLLMMWEGLSAAHASRLVGYESNSQFSREFKRLFGRTPTQEALHMKTALQTIKPRSYTDFSSSTQPRPWLS